MSNKSGTLYIGSTFDIDRRVNEHKNGTFEGFTKKYRCHHLIYVEYYESILEAVGREKQLKGWRRSKKIALIKTMNPEMIDLAENNDD